MGGGCTASSVVGGWAVLYVRVFLRPVGDEPFFLFLQFNTGLPLVLGSTTVPTAALLCPLLPYVLLLPCYLFVLQNLHTEDDTFTTVRTAALSYCPVIILFF